MSLSALKEKIMSEAAHEAAKIADANARVLEEERTRAVEELRILEEGIVRAAEQRAEHEVRSIHQQAEMEGRSLVLTAKQEELARIKEAFLKSLTSLPVTEKKKLNRALEKLVPAGKGEIIPEQDHNGFIFRGNGVEMNCTFAYLVDHLFWKYRSEIAKELFL